MSLLYRLYYLGFMSGPLILGKSHWATAPNPKPGTSILRPPWQLGFSPAGVLVIGAARSQRQTSPTTMYFKRKYGGPIKKETVASSRVDMFCLLLFKRSCAFQEFLHDPVDVSCFWDWSSNTVGLSTWIAGLHACGAVIYLHAGWLWPGCA